MPARTKTAKVTKAAGTRELKRAVSDADKEERRRAILAAAKREFAQKGYHSATVADVAKAAGLSYGSIYWYFDSKEALFHDLMEHEQRALRRHVAAATRADEDGTIRGSKAQLRDGVRAIFEFFEADKAAAKLLFRDSATLGAGIEQHLYAIYERFLDDIEKMVVAGQRAGVVEDAPSRLVAYSVGGLIGQIAIRRTVTDDGHPADEVADFLVSLVLDGLRRR
jgi:AcrR family transcriptional regulator